MDSKKMYSMVKDYVMSNDPDYHPLDIIDAWIAGMEEVTIGYTDAADRKKSKLIIKKAEELTKFTEKILKEIWE